MRKIRYKGGGHFEVNAEDISDWCQIRHVFDHARGHRYEAVDISKKDKPVVGKLRYIKDFPAQGVITFHDLIIEPEYQHRGVALALCFQLHADTPGYKYDTSESTEKGRQWQREVLDNEPHADGLWYEGRPKP
jgi:hypothetical protein